VATGHVLFVVKSTVKGGALITARIVLDYGTPVYVAPGDIDRVVSDPGSKWLGEVLRLVEPMYEMRNVTSPPQARHRPRSDPAVCVPRSWWRSWSRPVFAPRKSRYAPTPEGLSLARTLVV
jgi:hypothetical protein